MPSFIILLPSVVPRFLLLFPPFGTLLKRCKGGFDKRVGVLLSDRLGVPRAAQVAAGAYFHRGASATHVDTHHCTSKPSTVVFQYSTGLRGATTKKRDALVTTILANPSPVQHSLARTFVPVPCCSQVMRMTTGGGRFLEERMQYWATRRVAEGSDESHFGLKSPRKPVAAPPPPPGEQQVRRTLQPPIPR